MKKYFLFFLLLFSMIAHAHDIEVQPSQWWSGMRNSSLQLLLHAPQIGEREVEVAGDHVAVDSVVRPTNHNYLLIYLNIASAPAQTFNITLKSMKKQRGRKAHKKLVVSYTLQQRDGYRSSSFDASDVVYLLMPDRFSDGTAENNGKMQLRDAAVDKSLPDARHGGDLAGMTARLPYLRDLGVTTIWPTPLLINDMPSHSYHGYGITDYYRIDPRYGSNDDYRQFVAAAHRENLKVVQDMVFNHCGSLNPLYTDVPDSTWFNHHTRYAQTNYKTSAVLDPYASDTDRYLATDGWFVDCMPDFNQRNPHVLTYLIQNSIYWIEYAHIDGIRQDTYPYADLEAMNTWCSAVRREYPNFNIVGETWVNNNIGVASWQAHNRLTAPVDPGLPTVMDFPLRDALIAAVSEPTDDWNGGLSRIYNYLSQDRVFADPLHLLTFLENHDTDRFNYDAKQADDFSRYRMALTFLLTVRGIPQLYYGSEVAMWGNKSKGDGVLRQDFPEMAFNPTTMTPLQHRYYTLTQRLLQWRKTSKAVALGTTIQYAVRHGVYVMCRKYKNERCIVIANGSDKAVTIDVDYYRQVLPEGTYYDVVNDKALMVGKHLVVAPHDILLLCPKA